MVLDPITGTLAFVALADPALRGVSWIYGKYRLGREFGEHYSALTVKYKSEVARFVWIRDLKVDALEVSPLNEEETCLRDALHRRFVLEVKAFEECEKLMQNFHEMDNQEERAVSGSQSVATSVETTPAANATAAKSNDDDASAAQRAGHTTDEATLLTPVGTSSTHQSRTSSSKFHLPKFLKRNKQSHDLVNTSVSFGQVERAFPGAKEDCAAYDECVRVQHQESNLKNRTAWVLKLRKRFIELLDQITEHNNYFVSVLVLKDARKPEQSQIFDEMGQVSQMTKTVSSHLERLFESLAATEQSDKIYFQMMLLNDPFELWSIINEELPKNSLLRPMSSIFAFHLLKAPFKSSTLEPDGENGVLSLLFEVPTVGKTNKTLNERVKTERPAIDSFAQPFPTGEKDYAHSIPVWTAIGNVSDIVSKAHSHDRDEPIAVFRDRTSYVPSKTLQQSFNAPHVTRIGEIQYLRYRLRLACIIASSFTHFAFSKYPLDFASKSLYYYDDSAMLSSPDGESMNQKIMCPFIQLRVGAFPFTSTSSSVLSRSAETTNHDQVTVQKLGVLLCEVGRWKPVSALEDWSSVSAAAQIARSELTKNVPLEYYNVVRSCLQFAPDESRSINALTSWLENNVVFPLRRTLENLSPDYM
ncbi:hypothetical protein N7540_003379 [Penicillium herquei]|nr:hypothetical protein N7540_003379 [Penicillium herquei]